MSYDVTFDVPGHEDDLAGEGVAYYRENGRIVPEMDFARNYTSNVSPMWSQAIGENLGDLIERLGDRCGDLLPHLERGIATMKSAPNFYKALNPDNGWGDYDGALAYLEWMASVCRNWPEVAVHVWR